jgi:hypothetical protein
LVFDLLLWFKDLLIKECRSVTSIYRSDGIWIPIVSPIHLTFVAICLEILWLRSGGGDRAQAVGGGLIKGFDRRKIHKGSEYHPELREDKRETTKPYVVQLPDDPSFKVEGNLPTWENGRLRVGFNYVSFLFYDHALETRLTLE